MPLPNIAPNDALPLWQQIAAGAGVFVVAVIVGVYRFLKQLTPSKEEPARQVILETASLADMRPLHEMAASLRDILIEVRELSETGGLKVIHTELRALSGMLRERIEFEKDEAEIERRAKAMFESMVARQKVRVGAGRVRASRAKPSTL